MKWKTEKVINKKVFSILYKLKNLNKEKLNMTARHITREVIIPLLKEQTKIESLQNNNKEKIKCKQD